MNTPTPDSNPVQLARQLLKELQEQFAVFRDALPLALGIDKQIIAHMPEVNRKILRMALGIHTKSTRYLKQTQRATVRVNLDGEAAGEVLEEHRTHATQLLRERQKKLAEQHKAKREAEEMERKRNEKLAQLAQKFARSK